MRRLIPTCLALLAASPIVHGSDPFDPASYATGDLIIRDVAVIGGGSSGTYGAINLHRRNQSVVLIEREAILGGMTNSYTDPATGTTLDYGVQAFWNITTTRDYFSYLGISIVDWAPEPLTVFQADFQTGQPVTVSGDANFSAYGAQLDKYPWIEYSWNVPQPVPQDLVTPFIDFVHKYDLGHVAYKIYFDAQGLSNVLDQLTVHVMKLVDDAYIHDLSGAFVVTAAHDNGEIYTRALADLGAANVLLSSTVIAARRSSSKRGGVQLVVRTPCGNKLIQASKLLVSIPPLLQNMQPFDLDGTEADLFSRWQFSSYYTMLINNTGLPAGFRYVNANASNATFNIPQLPAPYQITQTAVDGLFYVWYGSPRNLTFGEVQDDVVAIVKRLQRTMNSTHVGATPHFVEFKSHTPFKLLVGAEDIENGFYQKLEGLQGHRNTWYTGAAFISHSSGVLWNFTNSLATEMLDS